MYWKGKKKDEEPGKEKTAKSDKKKDKGKKKKTLKDSNFYGTYRSIARRARQYCELQHWRLLTATRMTRHTRHTRTHTTRMVPAIAHRGGR